MKTRKNTNTVNTIADARWHPSAPQNSPRKIRGAGGVMKGPVDTGNRAPCITPPHPSKGRDSGEGDGRETGKARLKSGKLRCIQDMPAEIRKMSGLPDPTDSTNDVVPGFSPDLAEDARSNRHLVHDPRLWSGRALKGRTTEIAKVRVINGGRSIREGCPGRPRASGKGNL